MDGLLHSWPWWIVGPLIGLFVPLMIVLGGILGISSGFKHVCALILPTKNVPYLQYNVKEYFWNLYFGAGLFIGGFLGKLLSAHALVIFPQTYYSLSGIIILLIGGGLVGFGTRWAEGCTSGHAITGLSALQKTSLIAVCGFFAGGLTAAALEWLFKSFF